MEKNMIEELVKYSIQRIKNYRGEKGSFFSQYSQQLNDSGEGIIEIRAPRKYKGKRRLERRLVTAVTEFYSKHGFNLKEKGSAARNGKMHFEREINSLEKYLVSIERQGIFFYIHVAKDKGN